MVNGDPEQPGVYTMERSPMEVGLYAAAFGVIVAFLAWLAVGQIAQGRELSSLSADVRAIHGEITIRAAQRDAEHVASVKTDEQHSQQIAALAESYASIEQRLASFDDRQRHALGILERLPGAREKTR
jgi:hypothetical protein